MVKLFAKPRTNAPRDRSSCPSMALWMSLTASIGAGVTCRAPAYAQTAPDSEALQEIVVTAEKRSSTVQDTPISLTALSGAQLESQGITSVEQLAGEVPGISMRTAGPGQTEYEMRGLSSSGGSVATVGFYLDETPLSASAVSLNGRAVIDPELFDLNDVEVLRGPQGTLYGAGSMGGTIKVVTNPPKLGVFEGATDVSGSKTDGGGANGAGSLMLNLPIGEIAALRVVATERYVSGWIDRVVDNPFPFPTNPSCGAYFCDRGNVLGAPIQNLIKNSNEERLSSVRAALLVKPTDELSITGSLMYQRIDMDGYDEYEAPPGPLPGFPSSNVYAIFQPYNIPEPYYDQFKLASLVVKYSFPGADLTSATSYWDRFVIDSQDSTEALQNVFNLTAFVPTLFQEFDRTTQLSEELRLTSNTPGRFQWVAGLYAADLHSGYVANQRAPGFATATGCTFPISGGNCPTGDRYNINNGGEAANPDGLIFVDNNPNVMKQSAVFGEGSYRISSDWKLTAGVRYFKFTVANTSHQCGVGTGTGNATCQVGTANGSGNNLLPKLNLSYTPTPDLDLYGTISKGSRPGGVNLPIPLPTPAQLAANPNAYNCGPGSGPVYLTSQPSYFGPDSVWNFELGEKARFDDQRFTLNSDLYYVKWEDIQQIVSLSCGYPYNTNAGTAHAYGPELEFAARVTSDLTFNLSGAYTKADIYAPTPQSGIVAGTAIINVPKYTGTLALDYEHPISGDLRLKARLADAYTGPLWDIQYYRVELPSHNFLDGRLGVIKDKLAAYLVGTNLTNQHAALTIDDTTFAWTQPTITRVSTNQPRTIGVDLQYRF
jgi:iron complex outermembrane recepter protein